MWLMLNGMELIMWLGSILPKDSLTLLFIGIAILLFWIRKKYRFAYAMVEIFLGITAMGNTALHIPDVITAESRNHFALQVAAGIYIFIRGLDNAAQSVLWKQFWSSLGKTPET